MGICGGKYHQVGRVRVDKNNQLEPAYHAKGQSNCGIRHLPRLNLVNYSLRRIVRYICGAGSATVSLPEKLQTCAKFAKSDGELR